jgi:hypothetical protein
VIYNDINFDYKCDWSNGFNILYGFITGLFSSTSEREQRCSLRAIPYRQLSFSLWEEKAIAFKIMNEIRTAYQKTIYVPVYSEAFKAIDAAFTISNGSDYLINTEDIGDFYNLRNLCTDLFISDIRGITSGARTTFNYLTSASIYMDAILSSFSLNSANAIFYPLVPCYLDSVDITAETDSVINMGFVFKEKQC